MRARSTELELIDLPPTAYSKEEYRQFLAEMAKIGKISGGDRAGLKAFKQLKRDPTSILDVGCGSGYFTHQLAQQYKTSEVIGNDTHPQAIAYAQKYFREENLLFQHLEQPELNEKAQSFDVVTATLVCHHLNNNILIDFLKRAQKVSRQAIILNDLHRSWIAWIYFKLRAPFHFKSRLILNDGAISIKRSFKKRDWTKLLTQAGFEKESYTIKWNWPFRWTVTIDIEKARKKNQTYVCH